MGGWVGVERRGAGPGGMQEVDAGWLPREDGHQGVWMEACASRYVGLVLKGNTAVTLSLLEGEDEEEDHHHHTALSLY